MTKYVALHGNPGRGSNLALVTAHLWGGAGEVPAGEVEAPTRPLGGATLPELCAQIDDAVGAHDPASVCLLGYSFGAWLALQYATRAARAPGRIALVCPYVAPDGKLSPIARLLLATPGLGSWILQRATPKTRDRYLERTFAPETLAPALLEQLTAELSDPQPWRGAVCYKRLMETTPLTGLEGLRAEVLIVRGAEDEVAPWARQREALGALAERARVEPIAGAGHGLPWTQPAEVARRIAAWVGAAAPAAEGS